MAQAQTTQTQTTQTPQNPMPPGWELPVIGSLGLVCLILIVIDQLGLTGAKKQQIGRARWATWGEKREAQKLAYEQVMSPKLSKSALWINTPKNLEIVDGQIIIPFDRRTTWIPDISESAFVMGGTGAGKSYSIIDRWKFSATYQGHSILDFDAKGFEAVPPSCTTGGHALKLGYNVFVLDPNGDDTDSLNLWDALESEIDSDGALIIGDSFIANMDLSGGSGNAAFFAQAGGSLIAAIILMVKALPREYQDFAMVLKIVALPDLIQRVMLKMDELPEYVKGIWAQFLSQSGSPETAQSIAGTAINILGRMFTPRMLAVFRGDGTCPTELHGRTMVIFRLNPLRTAQKPLMAAAMEMLHRRSVFAQSGRKNQIGFFKDEAPQLKYVGLSEVLNLQRSLGGYAVLGAQGIASMEATHEKKEVEGLMGGTKTLVLGGVKGNRDTEYFSASLCKKQVDVKGKSKSHGKNSSRSDSESAQASPLLEPHEVEGLKQGQFVFKCPSVGTEQGSIPFKMNVRISKHEERIMKEGLEAWNTLRSKKKPRPLTDADLKDRERLANELLPLTPSDSLFTDESIVTEYI